MSDTDKTPRVVIMGDCNIYIYMDNTSLYTFELPQINMTVVNFMHFLLKLYLKPLTDITVIVLLRLQVAVGSTSYLEHFNPFYN